MGRAGNPDTMDGIEVVLDAQTALVDARGTIVTPGAVDSHMHWLSPQIADAALAGGVTTLVAQDFGPVWNLGANPAECLAIAWAALEGVPLNVALLVRASSSRPEGRRARARARAAPGSRSTRTSPPAPSRSAARSTSPIATTCSSRSTPTA